MSFTDNFQCMMRGGTVCIDKDSLFFILERQNELGINTIKIQQHHDGRYICKVDELTSEAFIEKFPIAPPYEVDKCFE